MTRMRRTSHSTISNGLSRVHRFGLPTTRFVVPYAPKGMGVLATTHSQIDLGDHGL
jgi:hypothetical protein